MASQMRGSRDLRRSLLIRSLKFDTPSSLVRKEFERFGAIRDVYLPLDYRSKKPRGFGFVEYVEERDARIAVEEMNGALLNGVPINVTFAQEGRKSPESMRYREYLSHSTGTRRKTISRYGIHNYNKSDPYKRYSPKAYGDSGFRKHWHSSYHSRSRSPLMSRSNEECKIKNGYNKKNDCERLGTYNSQNIKENSGINFIDYRGKKNTLEKNYQNVNFNEIQSRNPVVNQNRGRNRVIRKEYNGNNSRDYSSSRGRRSRSLESSNYENEPNNRAENEYSKRSYKNESSFSVNAPYETVNSASK